MHNLDTFTELQRAAQARLRALIWRLYAALKAYRADPTRQRRSALRARFDRIFRRRTGFVILDRLLARLHANKPELLRVLERPEIPLHTNGSERDIRALRRRPKFLESGMCVVGRLDLGDSGATVCLRRVWGWWTRERLSNGMVRFVAV